MLLNKEQVIDFLPQRDPFLFIDSVELIEGEGSKELRDIKGKRVICHFQAPSDHIIFQGHFPGNPILPGVIQIEMMGQASCFGVYYLFGGKRLDVRLMGVDKAKFRQPILPGMKMKVECTCLKVRSSFLSFECEITSDHQLISQAVILAAVNP